LSKEHPYELNEINELSRSRQRQRASERFNGLSGGDKFSHRPRQPSFEIIGAMSLNKEEEAFVKELARRAKAQNADGASLIQTKVGRVHMSKEECSRLDPVCAREGKTGTDLINEYL
jgi:hypothetical protein